MTQTTDGLEELLHRGYRYALSLTHNNEMAQDLVQDACVRISRRGGPWKIRYLITTIRNGFIDQCRRAAKIDFTSLGEMDLIADVDLVSDIDMSIASFDPPLELALAQLRDDERELLYLSIMEEYSASEIAKLTGRPRGTVLSILHRAKIKLQKSLAENVNYTEQSS